MTALSLMRSRKAKKRKRSAISASSVCDTVAIFTAFLGGGGPSADVAAETSAARATLAAPFVGGRFRIATPASAVSDGLVLRNKS